MPTCNSLYEFTKKNASIRLSLPVIFTRSDMQPALHTSRDSAIGNEFAY